MSEFNDKIDAYLLGKLSQEEVLAFEAELERDSDLAREVEFRKEMQAGLAQVEAEEVRDRIKGIAAAKTKRKTTWYWYAAASVALLLAVGWWFLPGTSPMSGPELFAEYYHPQVQIDQPRTPDGAPTLTDTLREHHAAKDFTFVQERLSRLPDSLKNRNLDLLEAVSLIELNRDKEADLLLASMVANAAPEYANEAAWLQALLHLRNEEYQSARNILEPIATDKGKLHQKEAAKILEEMGKRGQ